jgi:hypothetical protein
MLLFLFYFILILFIFLFYLNFTLNFYVYYFFRVCFWSATVQSSACPKRASTTLPDSSTEAAVATLLFLLATARSSTCPQRSSTPSCYIFVFRQYYQAPNQRNRAYHCNQPHVLSDWALFSIAILKLLKFEGLSISKFIHMMPTINNYVLALQGFIFGLFGQVLLQVWGYAMSHN